ncbi:MAG: calcium/sodium antiporter [Bacteroidales bacterium]|nr:calcium/sodium antiporter [Bacteroidales bacterium]
MLLPIVFILISLILLYFGSSWLVKGSSSLALKAGISPFITGLTIVAFGASSPELFVSVNATISGHGNIAIGNVIGSNLFNICIILGIAALITPLKIKMQLLKIDILILILTTVAFMILFADRQISRFEGGILLLGLILYTIFKILFALKEKNAEVQIEFGKSLPAQGIKWYYSASLILLGIGVLIAGSQLLVNGALTIARFWGVGETIISLTFIAAGTSIPLLASTIIASIKKENDIAIGTIIGSGIFNILGVIGVSSIINPLSAIAISNIDLYVMTGVTLLLLQFYRTQYILKRDDGIFMIGMYLIYLYYLWPK